MEERIPDDWVTTVCRILRTGSPGREIVTTLRVFTDWQAACPSAFPCDLVRAFLTALEKKGVTGKRVDQPESGVTYAFWFYYEEEEDEPRKLYGKICLKPDSKHVKLLSAHVPLRGDVTL
jgi:hypothetical protein